MKENPPHNLKKLLIRAAMLIVFFRPVSVRAYNHTSPDSIISCYSKFPVHLREYARTHCEKADISYELFLAVAYNESRFQPDATHINKNGTVDRGLCQINDVRHPFLIRQGLMTDPDSLFDPYTNIDCFIGLMEYHLSYTTDEYHALLAYQVGEGAFKNKYFCGQKTNKTHQFVWSKKEEISDYLTNNIQAKCELTNYTEAQQFIDNNPQLTYISLFTYINRCPQRLKPAIVREVARLLQ